MKMLLICIVFISMTAISLLNVSYFSKKKKIFSELIDFFKMYKGEINFSKNSISQVISRTSEKYCSETKQILDNYSSINEYPNCINEKEKKEIFDLFKTIGQRDVDSEISYSNNVIEMLEKLFSNAESDHVNKGLLRAKLIFILGLIIVIILI